MEGVKMGMDVALLLQRDEEELKLTKAAYTGRGNEFGREIR